MLRDIHYARVSTLDQSSELVQLAGCRQVSERDGAVVVAQFQDKESGLDETRDGYREALSVLRAGQADRLIIWRLDRFGRDQAEVAARIKELGRSGIKLVSATEGPIDEFLGGLLGVLAQRESRTTAIRVHAKMRDLVSRDHLLLTRPPYGYRLKPGQRGHWESEPEEAALVRRMFSLYATGEWSTRALVAWLNQQQDSVTGEPRRTKRTARQGGVAFTMQWVAETLRREAYIGTLAWNRQRRSKLDGHGLRPAGEHIRVPYPQEPDEQARWPLPPLVDAALFWEVQALLKERAAHRTARPAGVAPATRFLLASYLHCGACLDAGRTSTAMQGEWANTQYAASRGQRPRSFVYYCARGSIHGACSVKQRSGPQLDAAVLAQLAAVRFTPGDMAGLAHAAERQERQREMARAEDSAATRLVSLRAQLARTEARRRQLGMDRLDGVFSVEEYRQLATVLDADATALQADIAILQEKDGRSLRAAARQARALGDIQTTLAGGTLAAQRTALGLCVERVILRSRYPLQVEMVWQDWLRDLQEAGLATLPPTLYEAPPRSPLTATQRSQRSRARRKAGLTAQR